MRVDGGDPDGQESGADPEHIVLTPRKRRVLALVARGHTAKEIAQLTGLSRRTVEHYREDLRRRIGVSRTAGLIRFAERMGIV